MLLARIGWHVHLYVVFRTYPIRGAGKSEYSEGIPDHKGESSVGVNAFFVEQNRDCFLPARF